MLNFSASRLKLKLPLANIFYTNLPNLFTDPTPSGLSSNPAVTPHRQGALRRPPFPMLGFYLHLQMRFYPCTPPPHLPWWGQVGNVCFPPSVQHAPNRSSRTYTVVIHTDPYFTNAPKPCSNHRAYLAFCCTLNIRPLANSLCKYLDCRCLCLPLELKLSLRCRLPRLPFWILQNWE